MKLLEGIGVVCAVFFLIGCYAVVGLIAVLVRGVGVICHSR
jgi:hypothetical protein